MAEVIHSWNIVWNCANGRVLSEDYAHNTDSLKSKNLILNNLPNQDEYNLFFFVIYSPPPPPPPPPPYISLGHIVHC